jgi:hypothetical protein
MNVHLRVFPKKRKPNAPHKKTVMADEASASLSDNAVRGFLEQPKTYSVRGFDHAAADLFGDCAVGNGQDTRT